ncbi:MAG: hypothetical protein JSW28_05090, partial [Thermoplasmata archaeon]
MSKKGFATILTMWILLGSLVVISNNTEACFTWEVTCEDTNNGVDEGHYTTYDVEIYLRPGCKDTYWLYFWTEGVPMDWSTEVLDMDGRVIYENNEFFLKGTVTYPFTFKVIPPDDILFTEEATITLHIRADDRLNQNETVDIVTVTTCYEPLDRTPQPVTLSLAENTTNSIKLEWTENADT